MNEVGKLLFVLDSVYSDAHRLSQEGLTLLDQNPDNEKYMWPSDACDDVYEAVTAAGDALRRVTKYYTEVMSA